MTKKVVVACFGDDQSTERIHRLASMAEVVAVALDFGGVSSLAAIREVALASGATRCHAIDVREEFTRDWLLPALHQRTYGDAAAAFGILAPEFAVRKLEEVARLENATPIPLDGVHVAARPLPKTVAPPRQLDISFHEGVPVSINGVEMTLTELMESIETITGEPALCVLEREMARSRQLELA